MSWALGLFLFTLFAFLSSRLWRRHVQLARERFINRYDYARLLDARFAMKRTELNPRQRQAVFRALSEYFQTCRMAGKKHMVSMPSQVVDDAWHEFILFTRNYNNFCQRALGRFLHHIPAEAMRGPQDAQDGIKRAWKLACQREGIDPRNPHRLPLLFSIDRELGIADGFHYVPDCRNQVTRSDRSGTVYCGSHVGCGSGCGGGCGGSAADLGGDSGGDGGGCGGGGD
jgi:hypothetical protein